jgi:uncharacterized protein (TIGR00369 family)
MNIVDESLCFVCGKANERGLKLAFHSANGTTLSEFALPNDFQGYKNIIHGGVIAAILDEAMIQAAMAEGHKPVTAEITVRFKQPLSAGRTAIVEAVLTQNGPRIIKARSHISDKTSGVLIAEATGKMIPLKAYP